MPSRKSPQNTGLRTRKPASPILAARRQVEERLWSAETFELLVGSVRDYAIFMLDPDGYVATWNKGAERIKGYAPAEIIGRHFSVFHDAEDVREDKPQRELTIAREQGSVEYEGWRIRKDGSRFWANVVITAVHDEKGQLLGFAKVTRDETERRQAEETRRALLEQREARLQAEEERRLLEDSYRVAQEANRAKDEFLMTLSHELRTPMTAILGWARMLPVMRPQDPLFGEALGAIMAAAQLQTRLIDDILDVSRIVSGKLRLSLETVEIVDVVRNAIDAVMPTAEAKQISLRASMQDGLGSLVVDATRIQQVIWNLLSNAVKFTPRSGAVEVIGERTSSHVQIMVRDNGQGIDPQFVPHVFEPFRQAEMAHTRVHGGLGLGLSIVRHIVEAHGGRVTAASEGRGKGATFTVTLPVRALSTNAKPLRDPLGGGTFLHGDRLRGRSIVVLDDDQESRKLIAAVLRAAGAQVVAIDTADAALAAVDQQLPDIVITDIAMPEVDGYAFTRMLRERPGAASIKVIALSAFPAGADESATFDGYLTKPIDPFRLVEETTRIAIKART